MSIIGEAALTAFFDGLFRNLTSSDLLNFVTKKHVRKELKKWEKTLRDIRAVLDDAEQRQMKDQSVKKWLADLQDLAYDIDDILDEFATEALGSNLTSSKDQSQGIKNKVKKFLSPKSFKFNNEMISKIKEISGRMSDLATRRSQLEFRQIHEGATKSSTIKQRLQPTSVVNETHYVYGREKEKVAIVELLLGNDGRENKKVRVIPIVGMGGIGKTTLAQLVYNDPAIQSCFKDRAWVCVSDDFDAIAITKTILQSVAPGCYDNNDDLNLLQVKLKEKLLGKKLLLVLDDVWNENYEELTILLSPFGEGTKIVVTTWSLNVSSIMGTVKANPVQIQKLSEEDSLSILAQHALEASDFSGHPELKEVGENIVNKCNGLPLAAKAIGGLLRTSRDPEAWEEISKSEIWDIPEEILSILPALRLSYHHLPRELKRCFAYCSIIPKDYEFEEEDIVLLWEAEGFLQGAGTQTQPEVLGSRYFRDLVSRSLFQASPRYESHFIMHDLVNDLAQSVAGDVCFKLEDNKQLKFPNRTRHSSYVRGGYDGIKRFEAFDQTENLRTFLPLPGLRRYSCYLSNIVLTDLLPKFRCLRVLSLKGYYIIDLHPNLFHKLRHLRYLDFSHTKIRSLPDSICTLYNLETLLLFGCRKLEKLPSNFSFLVNLHVLDFNGAISLKGMPFGIDKLTNLRRLSNFVLGKGEGYQIQEIKNLSNLKGKLSISGLENVVKAQDAGEAKLIDKSCLDEIELEWRKNFDSSRNKTVEEEVLNFLEPHKKLKKLCILNYGGTKVPIWMNSSLQNLSSLVLRNCKNCISLPSIGKLPFLKDLTIAGMHELKKVGFEFYGENESNAFASLERLSFEDMPNWKEWDLVDEQVVKFPSLVELYMKNCPQLLGRLPNHLHSLEKLVISGCSQLVVSLSDLPMLCKLKIKECAELVLGNIADFVSMKKVSLSKVSKITTPRERLMSIATTLEYCEISSCKGLTYSLLKELGLLGPCGSLRNLEIWFCPQLVLLEPDEEEEAEEEPFEVGKLCSIETLKINEHGLDMESLRIRKHFLVFVTEMRIVKCPKVVSLFANNFPPVLKSLVIYDCRNLRCLVDEEDIGINNASRLEHLVIYNCPCLISLSLPVGLRNLDIKNCSKLASLSGSGKLPMGLKKLKLDNCPELESVAQTVEENTCLESIDIWRCSIKSLPEGLHKLNRLQKISLVQCENLVSLTGFLPTTNLTELWISNCANLRALPNDMHKLTSLQELGVRNEISIPKEGLSTNLISLKISVPRNYESLLEWRLHTLTSLKTLNILGAGGCPNMESFPPEEIGMMLPSSLTRLTISFFENLKCLSSRGFQNLPSLQCLFISSCPKLTSLPEKDMLLSLLDLSIYSCPLLKEECEKDKGREWSKIAHIPRVEFHEP